MREVKLSLDMRPKEGLISLDVFVEAVRDVNEMLEKLRENSGKDLRWQVTELEVHSAYVSVEPVGDFQYGKFIADLTMRSIRGLESLEEPPSEFGRALAPLKNLASLVRRTGMMCIVRTADRSERITARTLEMADRLLAETYRDAFGSVEGRMEMVTVHNSYQFNLYDALTDARIECYFDKEMLEQVKGYLGRRVLVSGSLRHDAQGRVKSLRAEQVQELLDDVHLPSVSMMAGIAPNITGGLNVKEYIRRLRDEQ